MFLFTSSQGPFVKGKDFTPFSLLHPMSEAKKLNNLRALYIKTTKGYIPEDA